MSLPERCKLKNIAGNLVALTNFEWALMSEDLHEHLGLLAHPINVDVRTAR